MMFNLDTRMYTKVTNNIFSNNKYILLQNKISIENLI